MELRDILLYTITSYEHFGKILWLSNTLLVQRTTFGVILVVRTTFELTGTTGRLRIWIPATNPFMKSSQACASGFNSTAGSVSCTPCPAGYDCTTSPGNATLCAAGNYSNYGEGICHPCPNGKVCSDPSQQPQVHLFVPVLFSASYMRNGFIRSWLSVSLSKSSQVYHLFCWVRWPALLSFCLVHSQISCLG